jgi:hypothetical protein
MRCRIAFRHVRLLSLGSLPAGVARVASRYHELRSIVIKAPAMLGASSP